MALYLGLMSGTSMDAIDTALVEINSGKFSLLAFREYPMPITLRETVRNINAHSELALVAKTDALLGELFAEAALSLLNESNHVAGDITAIGSHGQTVLHAPDANPPHSLQIGDANIIAARTGITTVADFRRMDMAFGGQGAPLAPLFHAEQFRTDYKRLVLNIGGFANISIIPSDPNEALTGFDTGPGNALMDDWIQLKKNQSFDKNGAWAASGTINKPLLEHFLKTDYFSKNAPKSTGRDDFSIEWLENQLKQFKKIEDKDVQATLLALTVESIATDIEKYAADAKEILVCGGGVYNKFLMQKLSEQLAQYDVSDIKKYGIEANAVEASCFAWLAYRRMEGFPCEVSSVTAARQDCLLGAIYKS